MKEARLWHGSVYCASQLQYFGLSRLKKFIVLYCILKHRSLDGCRFAVICRKEISYSSQAPRGILEMVRFVYFLPLFLIPWLPVFMGPLPPALAASSLRAFSSIQNVSCCLSCAVNIVLCCLHTGALLLHVSKVIFIEVLGLLLGSLQRLDLATFFSAS